MSQASVNQRVEPAAESAGPYPQDTDLAVLAQPGVAPLDRLRRHFGTLLARLGASTPAQSDQSDQPAPGEQLDQLEEWTEAMTDAVQDGQDEGDIASDRPARDVAILLIDSFEGSLRRARLTGEVANVRSSMDILLTSLTM
jgi:hypothetical protein